MNPSEKIFKTLSQRYSNPYQVQKFLKTFEYNFEKDGETVSSALRTYELRKAHCLEACLLTAAILEHKAYVPQLVYLHSKDDLGHTLFVFKEKTGWGCVARSRDIGLHGREPRFRSIRNLVWSYFDSFVDKTGRMTGYSLLNLDDSKTDWRFSKRNLWQLEKFIVNYPYKKITSSDQRFQLLHRNYQKRGSIPSGPYWW